MRGQPISKPEGRPNPGLARALRRTETEAEQIVWSRLRDRQLSGVKFRRQQSLGAYIVDFVSFEKNLVIEIDGGQHTGSPLLEEDVRRTIWLESQGFRVLRFWNNDVASNMDGVIVRIEEALE